MIESREIPTPIQFRIATPEDARTIMLIDEKAYPDDPDFQVRQEEFSIKEQLTLESKISSGETPRSFVAIKGDKPIGYMLIKLLKDKSMLITDWAILPEERDQNLALSMIYHVLLSGNKEFSFEMYARELTSYKTIMRERTLQVLIKLGIKQMMLQITNQLFLTKKIINMF